jgi:hypothetical protein
MLRKLLHIPAHYVIINFYFISRDVFVIKFIAYSPEIRPGNGSRGSFPIRSVSIIDPSLETALRINSRDPKQTRIY